MNNKSQLILNALKNQILLKYLNPIAQKPFIFSTNKKQKQQRPFQMYQYQQSQQTQTSYNALQQKIHNQIIYKFNQYLYKNQEAQLQMQLFCLEQAIQIRQNQIGLIKLDVENQKINKNMTNNLLQQRINIQQKNRQAKIKQQEIMKKLHIQNDQEELKIKTRSRCKIYTSLNCQIVPQQKIIKEDKANTYRNKTQNNPLKLNLKDLKKSLRQSHAIYSKRSQVLSSDNQQKERTKNVIKVQENKVKQVKIKSSTRQKDIKTIQNQINFYQRAWQDSKKKNKKQKGRQYKRKIFELLQQFWALKQQ